MGFDRLRNEVATAERRVEARVLRARTNWRALGTVWRQAWSPTRILVVGLAGGLLFARARPLGKLGGIPATRWIQLATSVSGLLATLRAKGAAEDAGTAAADAGQAADDAAETVEAATGAGPGPAAASDPASGRASDSAPRQTADAASAAAGAAAASVSDARRRPEAPWSGEPRAAEAATELSER